MLPTSGVQVVSSLLVMPIKGPGTIAPKAPRSKTSPPEVAGLENGNQGLKDLWSPLSG